MTTWPFVRSWLTAYALSFAVAAVLAAVVVVELLLTAPHAVFCATYVVAVAFAADAAFCRIRAATCKNLVHQS